MGAALHRKTPARTSKSALGETKPPAPAPLNSSRPPESFGEYVPNDSLHCEAGHSRAHPFEVLRWAEIWGTIQGSFYIPLV